MLHKNFGDLPLSELVTFHVVGGILHQIHFSFSGKRTSKKKVVFLGCKLVQKKPIYTIQDGAPSRARVPLPELSG